MKTLYICGYGLIEKDISILTLKILSEADIIISPSIEQDSFIIKYLNSLKQKKIIFKNIRHLNPSRTTYLIKSLFKKYSKIAAIFYGNPLFMNSITDMIISKIKGINIITLPAVSSLDMIFHQFPKLNMFKEKIVLLSNKSLEKASKRTNEIFMDTNSHTFVFGSENLRTSPRIRIIFTTSFKKYYGKKHPLLLLHFKDLTQDKIIIKKIKLQNLISNLNNSLMQTLYIPPKKGQL